MKKSLLTTIAIIISAYNLSADIAWEVDQARSKIGFTVKHLVFLDVEGRFKEFEGEVITPNKNSLENATINANIDVKSIYTGNKDRDEHLMSKDFFATDQFPNITFRSISINSIEKDSYKIKGELTIRDVTKTVELMAKCKRIKKLPDGRTRMDVIATGKVNRFDFKLQWNELMETGKAIVGEDVNFNLKIALLDSQPHVAKK